MGYFTVPRSTNLGMSEENRWHQFHLPDDHGRVQDLYFARSHQTEKVFAANQLYVHTDLADHVAIQKEYVCMQMTHHIQLPATCHECPSFSQTIVYGVGGKIHGIHFTGFIFVE